MKEKFDFEAALKAIQSGQAISGKDGVLAPFVKQLTEAAVRGQHHQRLLQPGYSRTIGRQSLPADLRALYGQAIGQNIPAAETLSYLWLDFQSPSPSAMAVN